MRLSEIMKRAKFERGTKNVILNLNLANIENEEDIGEIYNYAVSFVSKMPKNSMALLFDLRGLITNAHVEEQLKQMTIDCHKYFAASAIVVDSKTEETMNSIAKELGLSKMLTYRDVETANKCLVSAKQKNGCV